MEIQSIEIRNFRPYREVEADFTGRDGHIHIIEGPQGAGKTSFHRAVQWGLYGADGPATNYRTNWNDDARAEGDEEMSVLMKLSEPGGSHVLKREIRSFNHNDRRATERLRLISGEEERTGDEAQDFINERVPEDLKDFFFLDGEEIQALIDENTGRDIKEEIEKVLKHTAILNARDDLDTLLSDEYRAKRRELEAEHEERRELKEQIDEKDQRIKELRKKRSDLQSSRDSIEDDIEQARQLLNEHNQEAMDEIKDCEDTLQELATKKMQVASDLKRAWETLPLGILDEEITALCEELAEEEQRIEELLAESQRSAVISELVAEAQEGPCPICGSTHGDPSGEMVGQISAEHEEAELRARQVECRGQRRKLEEADQLSANPGELEQDLIEFRSRISNEEERKDRLLEEYSGEITDSERGRIEDNLNELEGRKRDLEREIDEIGDRIQEVKQEKRKLQSERRSKAGGKELEQIDEKIEAAERAKRVLRDVREAHIQAKREKIREEMNKVFTQVSQSEFIRDRYDGIDFKGAPDEEDEYVLQLVKSDGTRKRMDEHPPSAGETQLTALSFIFGLNKYANYSTTIVFDTVAGRLDLENSYAQGEFFSSLDEPLILLVTDAEFDKLSEAIEGDVGAYYRIQPDSDLNSVMTEVKQ